jgi:hypothetical protein
VRVRQRLALPATDAEPGDGAHLTDSFAQRCGGVGMVMFEVTGRRLTRGASFRLGRGRRRLGQVGRRRGHTSKFWTEHCNDVIRRICDLYPGNFAPVCQLPQTPGDPEASISNSVAVRSRSSTATTVVDANESRGR